MAVKNKLTDLHNLLFEQLERLITTEDDDTELTREIERSRMVAAMSKQIVENGKLMLDARKHADEMGFGTQRTDMPSIFKIEGKGDDGE